MTYLDITFAFSETLNAYNVEMSISILPDSYYRGYDYFQQNRQCSFLGTMGDYATV